MSTREAAATELAGRLGRLLDGEARDLRRLSGGASRETWAFDLHAGGGVRPLILRRDPPGRRTAGGMAKEAALLRAAAETGVPVPSLVAASDQQGDEVVGAPFLVMERVEGETIPRRILRQPDLAPARRQLAAACGRVLGAVHAIDLKAVSLDGGDQLAQWRTILDGVGRPQPTFELAFRWLAERRPEPAPQVVVHGDFRNGNLIVGPDGLRAVLDWELAHRGQRGEDLGWLCAPPWRFGVDRPVGGFGTYEQLLAAYEEASGVAMTVEELRWWEVLATLKWGVMCMLQAGAHLSGASRSVELAAIGRRVAETEWDLLELIEG